MQYGLAAAQAGVSAAQNLVGWMYGAGEAVAADSKVAVQWMQKAAAQNNPQALHNLGFWYETGGCGLAKDLALAKGYYEAAIGAGYTDTSAVTRLGTCFMRLYRLLKIISGPILTFCSLQLRLWPRNRRFPLSLHHRRRRLTLPLPPRRLQLLQSRP
jgi:hypothetical protein